MLLPSHLNEIRCQSYGESSESSSKLCVSSIEFEIDYKKVKLQKKVKINEKKRL